MSIILEKGDLFAVEADVIAHGANCRGVMGAGIAKAFKAKFPEMYREYKERCERGDFIPGDYMTFSENGVVGVNLFTQENPGPDATFEAVVISLFGVSQRMTRSYLGSPPVLAMPLIGCGIGGLNFHDLYEAVVLTSEFFPRITYKIVYNDDNESQIPEYLRA